MSTRLPSRDTVHRLAHTASRYRDAFAAVQDILRRADLGRVPSWVFAVDRMPLEELAVLNHDLAVAEHKRRQWRVALDALVELYALTPDEEQHPGEVREMIDRMQSAAESPDSLLQLDRFISVINAAKAGGCIYVNGGFEPVEHHVVRFDGPALATVDGAPDRSSRPVGAEAKKPRS